MTDPRREWLKLRAGIDFAVRMNEAECRREYLDKDGNVLRWITYAALFQGREPRRRTIR